MKDNSKIVTMMHGHKKSNALLIYSYHGPLTLFDDQVCFNTISSNPMDFYKAALNKNGRAIFEQDINNEVVEEILEIILFEVFLY